MHREYVEKKFNRSSQLVIQQANVIIEQYQAEGYVLTLRQLYYRFVAQAWLENTVQNYKRLGSIVNDARLAGEIDWEAIEDRTRELHVLNAWRSPSHIISDDVRQLEPTVLAALVRDNVALHRDDERWEEDLRQQEMNRRRLLAISQNWPKVIEALQDDIAELDSLEDSDDE